MWVVACLVLISVVIAAETDHMLPLLNNITLALPAYNAGLTYGMLTYGSYKLESRWVAVVLSVFVFAISAVFRLIDFGPLLTVILSWEIMAYFAVISVAMAVIAYVTVLKSSKHPVLIVLWLTVGMVPLCTAIMFAAEMLPYQPPFTIY